MTDNGLLEAEAPTVLLDAGKSVPLSYWMNLYDCMPTAIHVHTLLAQR